MQSKTSVAKGSHRLRFGTLPCFRQCSTAYGQASSVLQVFHMATVSPFPVTPGAMSRVVVQPLKLTRTRRMLAFRIWFHQPYRARTTWHSGQSDEVLGVPPLGLPALFQPVTR